MQWNRGKVTPPWGAATCRGFALVEILVATLLGSAVIGGTFKVLEVSLQSSRVARSSLTEQELTVLIGNVLNDSAQCRINLNSGSADFTDIGSGNWRLAKLIKDTETLLQTGQDFQSNLEIIDMQLQTGGSLDRRFVVFYKKKNMGNLNTLGGGANCSSSDTTDCYYAYCDLDYATNVPSSSTGSWDCGSPSCVYFNASSSGGGGNPECYKVTDGSGTPQKSALVGCGDTDQITQNETVAIGFEAGKSTTQGKGVFIGFEAGKSTSSSDSAFVGYRAGKSATGYKNTFIGYEAGNSNEGGDNTYLGYRAGENSDAGGNVFIGSEAGHNSSGNTGSDNTFVGFKAGRENTSGVHNIFIGMETGNGPGGVSAAGDYQLNIGNLIYGRQPNIAPTTNFFGSSYLGSSGEGVVINGKLYAEEQIEAKEHIKSEKHIAAAEYVKVGVTTASCTTSIAGALRYQSSQIEFCNGSAWTALTGGGGATNCASTTMGNCALSSTSDGGTSGSCASGYSGSCSYRCNNGYWSQVSNSCSSTTYSSCSASTASNCVRSYTSHGGTSGTCASGYSGSC